MSWKLVLDTSFEEGFVKEAQPTMGDRLTLEARSMCVFILQKREGASDDEMSDHVKATTKYSIY